VAVFKSSVDSVPSDALWSYLTDPFQQPPTSNQQKSLDGMFLTIARAGWALWATLTADPDLAKFLHDINALPANSRVSVITNSIFIPWEMIYPENPDALAVKPALLWGARYLFHTTLPQDSNIAQDKKAHRNSTPGASLCVNPAIDDDFAGVSPLPAASHHAWAAQARLQNIPCDEADPAAARALLLGNGAAPSRKWIYLFCHGLGGAGNAIDLGGTPPNLIQPASLAGTPPFDGRPIVFLNSCGSGAHSALALTNFYTAFRRDKQALGLVATSCPVPATTAAAIGQRISSLYLDGSHDLAAALQAVRLELIARNIPIGLFYTLHAPRATSGPGLTKEPSMSAKPVVIVISDLHLGGGGADKGDDHVFDQQQLAGFIDTLRASDDGQAGRIELYINGISSSSPRLASTSTPCARPTRGARRANPAPSSS
jgi:hypothetical protein